MNFEYKLESISINVKLKNKRHVKHCYLRVLDSNLVQIKANIYFSQEDAKKLLQKKESWILEQIKRLEKNALNEDEFLYFGKIQKKELYNIKDVDKFYKEKIQEYIPYLVDKHSKLMRLYPTSIKYRKNKNTWGSCNHKNGLNFNTLLCKFPLEVMEYVVIHELAHIKHKNHSRKFWDLVEMYCPNYKNAEETLRSFL